MTAKEGNVSLAEVALQGEAYPDSSQAAKPKGPKVENDDELCLRQIHPQFFVKGRLTPMAFRLKDSDRGLLSISLKSKTTYEDAYAVYTSKKNVKGEPLKACGTWAVEVGECRSIDLAVYEDPTTDEHPDLAHGSIDMTHLLADDGARQAKQDQLRAFAQERGPVFTPAT